MYSRLKQLKKTTKRPCIDDFLDFLTNYNHILGFFHNS